LVNAHPNKSGIHALPDERDAFAARILLAQFAEGSLDIQYYIWHLDMSGTLLLQALVDAANRGVRVRLLLDDNNMWGMDPAIAALDSHPSIEVRLFNPVAIRKPRLLGYLADFVRLNRRMHNKSFTADNQATIVGGRNIGDDYFGGTEGLLFADLDVLAFGPVVHDVSTDFERYWASDSSFPVHQLLPRPSPDELKRIAAKAKEIERSKKAAAYMSVLKTTPFIRDLSRGTLPMEWASTRMVSDDPAKALGKAARETHVTEKLKNILGQPESTVDLVSPYLVLQSAGVEAFASMAKRGVKIRMLTNSIEATDLPLIHAGYAKRRKDLLEAGIALFELRRTVPEIKDGLGQAFKGSSRSSLHAKTFAADNSRVFVGSFNFDPRSANLNTELGFVIKSSALATKIKEIFDDRIPYHAFEVRIGKSGKPEWIERQRENVIIHHVEPGTTFGKRAVVWFLSVLPIEWLL